MKFKELIRDILKESLSEQKTIDSILDKINKVGIDNITNFEKEILSKATEYSEIENDTKKWLDSNYSDLHLFGEKRKSFGRDKEFLVFLNDDMEMIFEYDKSNKTLYVSHEDIVKNLGEHFNKKSFKKYFFFCAGFKKSNSGWHKFYPSLNTIIKSETFAVILFILNKLLIDFRTRKLWFFWTELKALSDTARPVG